MQLGLTGSSLGENVYKKRISLNGQGKRGGVRSIVAYKSDKIIFFIFGYAKNEKENITPAESKAVKALAAELLSYSVAELDRLVSKNKLIKVYDHG